MNKRAALIALTGSLAAMAFLLWVNYRATGQGAAAGFGRLLVIALLGYLAMHKRGWAAFVLALWFGLAALALVVGAVDTGGLLQIVIALPIGAFFIWSSVVMWRVRKAALESPVPGTAAPPTVDGDSSG